jgi:DNA mismatch repair ATPase MutS
MRVFLMYRDKDFELRQPSTQSIRSLRQAEERARSLQALLWNAIPLMQDLELGTLLHAMAGNDQFMYEVAQQAILSGLCTVDAIHYRQAILRDCLKNSAVVRGLYDLMTEVTEEMKRRWWGTSSHYPSSMLYSSVELMEAFLDVLQKLRSIAEENAGSFESEGFRSLFATLKKELNQEYLAMIKTHVTELKFRKGVLLSAELGDNNEGTCYILRKMHGKKQKWLERFLAKGSPCYTFRLDPRDEAGGKILSEMRDRGISRVARTLAESADHVSSFFKMLRTELAFYVGCLNLHGQLAAKGMPVAFPLPKPGGEHGREFTELYDACLALTMVGAVVGNTVHADGKSLMIVTGANQGGKSTFLRSIGLAQMMMQCGLFVGAEAFKSELCPGLFTHYKREEDATMKCGKFDEELARMSDIVEHLVPNSMLLFNESFAATNDREGSEIAKQIVRALLEKKMRVVYVTHLYELARGFFDEKRTDAIFLRAERNEDGTRTFRLVEREPLKTSYGEDLYRKVFADKNGQVKGG